MYSLLYISYTFVMLLKTYLLSISSVPGPVWALGAQVSPRTDRVPALRELRV